MNLFFSFRNIQVYLSKYKAKDSIRKPLNEHVPLMSFYPNKKGITSDLGRPPLYFNIKFSSFSSVTFNFTFCLGVLSPLPT
jgi:hypothetical protein